MLNTLDWIVIPGGPGLSNNYLKYGLKKPFTGCSLHFYNMLGAPESNEKNPSIEEMVAQIGQIAGQAGLSEYGLISHSFGNYLAMRSLEVFGKNIKAIIMINHMPFEFHAWQSALTNIVKKVPESVLKKIADFSNDPSCGSKIFEMIYPYYIGEIDCRLPIDVPFDMQACDNISKKVTEYDDKIFVQSANVPWVSIVGEKDPFFNVLEVVPDKTVIMPRVGHYAFFEDPDGFCEAVKISGELLCQQTAKMTKKCC